MAGAKLAEVEATRLQPLPDTPEASTPEAGTPVTIVTPV